MSGKKQKVCYVLSYYSPSYVRTKTLTGALEQIQEVELYRATNRRTGLLRYFETLAQLIAIRLRSDPDVYILGFRGYEIFWFVRLITLGRPLIFDHFMSPYDNLVYETGRVAPGSLVDRLIFYYEKAILWASDTVLTDTDLHRRYFVELFDLPEDKITALPIGADEALVGKNGSLPAAINTDEFTLFFYGTFLPLHGMDVILDAAAQISDLPVRFLLVGGRGRDLTDFHQQIEELQLANVTHFKWVEHNDLDAYICAANLCLGGPFGGTGQATRVVTGKTYQFLAMGRPTIVGDIAEDVGFVDKENCLIVPQRDPDVLAETIRWAFEHRSELEWIGQAGRRLFVSEFSTGSISRRLEMVRSMFAS